MVAGDPGKRRRTWTRSSVSTRYRGLPPPDYSLIRCPPLCSSLAGGRGSSGTRSFAADRPQRVGWLPKTITATNAC